MSKLWCVMSMLFVTGCHSILDPAPYSPLAAPIYISGQQIDRASLFRFVTLEDASSKMQALSDGYSWARDEIMRQQLAFDLPIIGLAAATVGSSIFGASKDQILALGLGSAGLAGARLYFGPQGRVVAYNAAALALSCGAAVAADLGAIKATSETNAQHLSQLLTSAIEDVADIERTAPVGTQGTQTRAALLSARDEAQKALDELNKALATLQVAPTRLQIFGAQVIRNTTSKVVTGAQNMDAALAAIKAVGNGTPAKPSGAPLPAVAFFVDSTKSESTLTRQLRIYSAQAQGYAKLITDAWSALTNCTSN